MNKTMRKEGRGRVFSPFLILSFSLSSIFFTFIFFLFFSLFEEGRKENGGLLPFFDEVQARDALEKLDEYFRQRKKESKWKERERTRKEERISIW